MAILRADGIIALTPAMEIALRGDLAFVIRNPVTTDNPAGQFISGLGDADVQAALIRQFDSRWAAGAGLRFVAPTGAEDITSGKWRTLPVAGARYSLPEEYRQLRRGAVTLRRQFRGRSVPRNVSNLQLAPMLNINLPEPLVRHALPEHRNSHQLRRSAPRPDRPPVPADRLHGWAQCEKDVTLSLELSVPVIKDYRSTIFERHPDQYAILGGRAASIRRSNVVKGRR